MKVLWAVFLYLKVEITFFAFFGKKSCSQNVGEIAFAFICKLYS